MDIQEHQGNQEHPDSQEQQDQQETKGTMVKRVREAFQDIQVKRV